MRPCQLLRGYTGCGARYLTVQQAVTFYTARYSSAVAPALPRSCADREHGLSLQQNRGACCRQGTGQGCSTSCSLLRPHCQELKGKNLTTRLFVSQQEGAVTSLQKLIPITGTRRLVRALSPTLLPPSRSSGTAPSTPQVCGAGEVQFSGPTPRKALRECTGSCIAFLYQ